MTQTPSSADWLREKLAAIEHERWSSWQKYMHSKLEDSYDEGSEMMLPYEWFERWERQIKTPYDKLTASEKASDMEQVDRYWPLIQAHLTQETIKARLDELRFLLEDFGIEDNTKPIKDRIKALTNELEGVE